ncbi:hypothetical protein [Clostridium tertium]|uniref:hypothetical protein n=1 Tax=Clostridium tertium TaxID=1559 RepID=UPI001AE32399|nr:hypothetical protein [Clostridium tertium]MBP1869900.1 ribosomal protein S1 [Clostridium tertium]
MRINEENFKMHLLNKNEKGKYDLGDFGTFEILDINNEEDKIIIKVRVTGEQAWENFYIRNDVENEYYKRVSFYKKNINNKIDILFNI